MKINAILLGAGLSLTLLTTAAAQKSQQPDSLHVHIIQNKNGNLLTIDTVVPASQHEALKAWLISKGVALPAPPPLPGAPGEVRMDSVRMVIQKIELDSAAPGLPPLPPAPPVPPGAPAKVMVPPPPPGAKPAREIQMIIIDDSTGEVPKVPAVPGVPNDGKEMRMVILKDSLGQQQEIRIIRQLPDNQKTDNPQPAPKEATNDKVIVYPNPSNGHITLAFDIPFRVKTQITITDMNGRLVYREELTDAGGGHYQKEIDLSKYGKGMYSVEVMKGDQVSVEKVMVE